MDSSQTFSDLDIFIDCIVCIKNSVQKSFIPAKIHDFLLLFITFVAKKKNGFFNLCSLCHIGSKIIIFYGTTSPIFFPARCDLRQRIWKNPFTCGLFLFLFI